MSSYGFNWLHAQYFHRVALTKNMRQTALYFEVSPSTVSRGLRKFEEEHGKPLFRDLHKLVLTEHGLALWPHLDQLVSAWLKTKAALDEQRDQPFDVALGVPEILTRSGLLEQMLQFAQSHGIRLMPTGEAPAEAVALGEPQIGIVRDRPIAQPSLAESGLITGGRFDVWHGVYRSPLKHAPQVLVGSYSDVEWESIARVNYWDLPHARHNAMCAVTSGESREHIARIGMGLVALPMLGEHADPTLEMVPDCAPTPLYSLHVLMHPAYRESKPHRLIREHLVHLLANTPTNFYDQMPAPLAARALQVP